MQLVAILRAAFFPLRKRQPQPNVTDGLRLMKRRMRNQPIVESDTSRRLIHVRQRRFCMYEVGEQVGSKPRFSGPDHVTEGEADFRSEKHTEYT